MNEMDARKAEKNRRSILVYALAGIFGCSLFVFMLWSLRALIPPILIGALLAYVFRPLKTAFRVPWLPDALRICLVFVLLGGVISSISYMGYEMVPSESQQLELMVRLRYKLNLKYKQFMGLSAASASGNWLHQMVGRESDPMVEKINDFLALSDEQKKKFLMVHPYKKGLEDRYLEYFRENNKNYLPGLEKRPGF